MVPTTSRSPGSRAGLRLGKYHGLGNDFLVVDGSAAGLASLSPGTVRALCDRRRGVGADGIMLCLTASPGAPAPAVASAGVATLRMVLYNADGSRAEMSGNGIRCLALFARDAGLVSETEMTVLTDAGRRRVQMGAGSAPGLATVRVDMGRAVVGASEDEVCDPVSGAVWRGRSVAVGNPHLVLVADDLDAVEVAMVGPGVEASRPGGVNVEWVRPGPGPGELELRVWERGAGVTAACGTGSVAAAAAATAMGLVSGPRILVHNPGGTLEVELSGGTAWLAGPAQRVAWVEVDRDLLAVAGDAVAGDAVAGDAVAGRDDWAAAAEGGVEWRWDWAAGPGWGSRRG